MTISGISILGTAIFVLVNLLDYINNLVDKRRGEEGTSSLNMVEVLLYISCNDLTSLNYNFNFKLQEPNLAHAIVEGLRDLILFALV